MINLIPVFAGPHLSTLADLLGVALATVRRIHRSAGVMAIAFTVLHVLLIIASKHAFPLDQLKNLFTVIVSAVLVTGLC